VLHFVTYPQKSKCPTIGNIHILNDTTRHIVHVQLSSFLCFRVSSYLFTPLSPTNVHINYAFIITVTASALALSFLFNRVLTVTVRLHLLLSKQT